MAAKTVIVDDLDGTEGAKTFTFSFQGNHYAIDLNDRNGAKMAAQFQTWIDAARRDSGRQVTSAPKKKGTSHSGAPNEQLQAVRDWANKNGYKVSYRGKIAQHVMDAFDAAHDAEGALTGKPKVAEKAAAKPAEKKPEAKAADPAFSAAAK